MTEREALDLGSNYRRNSLQAFVFMLRYLRPHLRRVVLICLVDISIVAINLVVPWLGKLIIDTGFANRDWDYVLRIALGVAGMTAMVYALSALRTFLYNTTDLLLGLDLRRAMYGHLQRLSLETVESLPIGQMQFRVTTDSDRIAHMLVRVFPTLTMLVEFGLILAAAIYVDPVLAGIVLCFLVPWTAFFIYVTHYGRVLDRRRLGFGERRDAGVLQAAASFATIKSMGRERREIHRNGMASVALQRIANQGYLILIPFEFFTLKLLPYVKSTTIYVLLAQKVVIGEMTLGMTAPMIAYLSRLTYPIERIVNFGCWIWQTMVSAERMMQILSTKPSIENSSQARRIGRLEGEIAFKDVSFERPECGMVLQEVDLVVAPGSFVAIVGPSGAGKSTLLSLALRLHDPTKGQVSLDSHDLRDLDRNSFLRQMATVTQDTFVFGGTLAENLRVVSPHATDEELRASLGQVEMAAWLNELPDGLDQDLDGGLGLSAGQKQRLGIARALLADARVLLLDEPTSALDPETERQVMATVHQASEGRTTLLVTHRLSTVEKADEIVVLDKGRIVQRGCHSELVSVPGLYADLVRLHRSLVGEALDFEGAMTR